MSHNSSYTAIQVESLGKRYYIGKTQNERDEFIAQTLMRAITSPVLKSYNLLRGKTNTAADLNEEFWALEDVNFSIEAGEVVGIIGRNGAGKSTLLKILTRITTPTKGRSITYGKVSSLLEVGTGFHPELTGRENVYLNGSILGMLRDEIDSKFDEIVDFAGVESFIDTPVKHYSSGMSVRLAFAVAAHLRTDILLVDEVLAVGDIAFQKKCFDKINSIAHEGRTIIMVSHNMQAITRFCERGILLDQGRLLFDGPINDTIANYIKLNSTILHHREWQDIESSPGNEFVRLKSIGVSSENGRDGYFDIRYPIQVEFQYWSLQAGETYTPAFMLKDESDIVIFTSGGMHMPVWKAMPRQIGLYRSVCQIPGNLLREGQFTIDAYIHDISDSSVRSVNHVHVSSAVQFTVYDEILGDSARGTFIGQYPGIVRPILEWNTEVIEANHADIQVN